MAVANKKDIGYSTLQKITIGVVVAVCIYALCFWNSLRKIDNFCNSVDTTTKISDLSALAQRAGVDLRGPVEMPDSSGAHIYAIAASGFTIGEYACSIHGASLTGTVTKKRLGY